MKSSALTLILIALSFSSFGQECNETQRGMFVEGTSPTKISRCFQDKERGQFRLEFSMCAKLVSYDIEVVKSMHPLLKDKVIHHKNLNQMVNYRIHPKKRIFQYTQYSEQEKLRLESLRSNLASHISNLEVGPYNKGIIEGAQFANKMTELRKELRSYIRRLDEIYEAEKSMNIAKEDCLNTEEFLRNNQLEKIKEGILCE